MWLAQYTAPLARGLSVIRPTNPGELTYAQACEMLEAYYLNNDLYRAVSLALREAGYWGEAMRELRNPTYAAVEFYVMTLWPGPLPDALPLTTENAALREPIERIWKWSNWGTKKQFAVRQFALTGDLFLRVATSGEPDVDRVYIQAKKSKYVTDFEEDERGNIVWLRYDVPKIETQPDGTQHQYTHTEVWDTEECRIWKNELDETVELDRLGTPDQTLTMQELGIDFVPWVRAPFQDIGDANGLPLIWPVLSKIDEVNRKATRLAQLMFRYNKAFWALKANQVDQQGRPLPAPQLKQRGLARDDSDALDLKDDDIFRLPGNASLEAMVPSLNYGEYLNLIKTDLDEIKRDLPELQWYELLTTGNPSGRALAYQMAPAINKVIETRGNAESALVKAQMMALTMGQNAGLWQVGSYDDGALEHSFAKRDVLPLSEADRADVAKVYVDMGVPAGMALRRYAGWSEDDAGKVDAAKAATPAPAAGPPGTGKPVTREEAAPMFAGIVKTPDMAGQLASTGMLTRAVNRARVNGGAAS